MIADMPVGFLSGTRAKYLIGLRPPWWKVMYVGDRGVSVKLSVVMEERRVCTMVFYFSHPGGLGCSSHGPHAPGGVVVSLYITQFNCLLFSRVPT